MIGNFAEHYKTIIMEPKMPRNYQVCRKLDLGDDDNSGNQNIPSVALREEIEKDKLEFKNKYNFDVDSETPLPGKYVYRLENGTWIGALTAKTEIENDVENVLKEDDGNVQEIHMTPISNGSSNNIQPVKKRYSEDNDNDENNIKKGISRKLF